MEKAQGFEIAEYDQEHEIPARALGLMKEIIRDIARVSPSTGIQISFTGNLAKLTFHSYEMHLPVRMREVEERAKDVLNEAIKVLKKELKAQGGFKIDFKEKKEMANTSVQKTSLNERYVYSSWRFYEISE